VKIGGSAKVLRPVVRGAGLKFAVLASRFNAPVTERLLEGCLETLRRYGARDGHVSVKWVPGAFELPLAAQKLARTGRFHAVIALGCVIRGETPHDRYISHAAAQGLQHAALSTGVPMIFGVLTPLNAAQARARAGTGHHNKGVEAALAALEMANFMRNKR
jgi:6,7-dimethyl-8-ribityllumazine synthase